MDTMPQPLAQFASTHLASLEDLKVLALCVAERDRWHDAPEIARTLRLPRGAARSALDRLARNNLLDIRITGDVRYRFRPGTWELEAQALALVDAYRRNPTQASEAIRG
jgi:DNA-binding IclR family transcriptional regulator